MSVSYVSGLTLNVTLLVTLLLPSSTFILLNHKPASSKLAQGLVPGSEKKSNTATSVTSNASRTFGHIGMKENALTGELLKALMPMAGWT